ncbi:MAG: hypothetical protein GYA59_05040 [Chloroflexi bacterium]|nr:hypothetical protein [Chloroflexota bacterium]
MDVLFKFILPGILFLLTLVSGFWLSSLGKPLNTAVFTIHKLIALAVVVLTAVRIFEALKNVETHFLLLAAIGIAGLCFVALFATGALMSLEKLDYAVMRTVHQVAPFVAALAVAVAAYLLAGRTA